MVLDPMPLLSNLTLDLRWASGYNWPIFSPSPEQPYPGWSLLSTGPCYSKNPTQPCTLLSTCLLIYFSRYLDQETAKRPRDEPARF